MVTELKTAKRCNWCRKRLQHDHNLAICSECAKRLSEMLTR